MYTVVVLAEQPLNDADAAEIVSLHESIEDTRRYHLVVGASDKAAEEAEPSVERLRAHDVEATGEPAAGDPVDQVARVVSDHGADEVIVMTLSHAVSELLHLDWTSKARRRVGVPVLHLLEHQPLDAEADNGQGITGM